MKLFFQLNFEHYAIFSPRYNSSYLVSKTHVHVNVSPNYSAASNCISLEDFSVLCAE